MCNILFCSTVYSTISYYVDKTGCSRAVLQKSCIWESLNLLTDSSTNTKTDRNGQKGKKKKKSCVSYHMSGVTFHVSPVTCHLSLTPTATAT